MADYTLPVQVMGHVKIVDDLGQVLLDKKNAVHPQNMARLISRALAHEANSYIHRIAFGNGGTVVSNSNITYNTPNDGINDIAGYASRLYNETYYEIIDENNTVEIGSGPGAYPAGDGASTPNIPGGPGVYSQEVGSYSQVLINVTLNQNEPSGQYLNDNSSPADSDFEFDEIGLFTSGAPDSPTAGYQMVNVGNKTAADLTGLNPNTLYTFDIVVDGVGPSTIQFTTPAAGTGPANAIIYSDIIPLINAQLVGCTVSITDAPTVQTFGYLKFTSNTTGTSSTVQIVDETLGSPGVPVANWLFTNLVNFSNIETGVAGVAAGVQNDPTQPTTEVERLLTHLIFSPVTKTANRTITITYTLTVTVAQSA